MRKRLRFQPLSRFETVLRRSERGLPGFGLRESRFAEVESAGINGMGNGERGNLDKG